MMQTMPTTTMMTTIHVVMMAIFCGALYKLQSVANRKKVTKKPCINVDLYFRFYPCRSKRSLPLPGGDPPRLGRRGRHGNVFGQRCLLVPAAQPLQGPAAHTHGRSRRSTQEEQLLDSALGGGDTGDWRQSRHRSPSRGDSASAAGKLRVLPASRLVK